MTGRIDLKIGLKWAGRIDPNLETIGVEYNFGYGAIRVIRLCTKRCS